MVKDMDSYIDGCIGKDDFFKLATVNQLWTNSALRVLQSFPCWVLQTGRPTSRFHGSENEDASWGEEEEKRQRRGKGLVKKIQLII